MSGSPRCVFDTTTLVGAVLFEASTPGRALQRALAVGSLLLSADTLREVTDVFRRSKFDRYVTASVREEFLESLVARAVWLDVTERLRVCRDPDDDKFLALATTGAADVIVSGDRDLLVLHPFRGVDIMTPATFLEAYHGTL